MSEKLLENYETFKAGINNESRAFKVGTLFFDNPTSKFSDAEIGEILGCPGSQITNARTTLRSRYGFSFNNFWEDGQYKNQLKSINYEGKKKTFKSQTKGYKSPEEFTMTDVWRIALGLQISPESRKVLYGSLAQ